MDRKSRAYLHVSGWLLVFRLTFPRSTPCQGPGTLRLPHAHSAYPHLNSIYTHNKNTHGSGILDILIVFLFSNFICHFLFLRLNYASQVGLELQFKSSSLSLLGAAGITACTTVPGELVFKNVARGLGDGPVGKALGPEFEFLCSCKKLGIAAPSPAQTPNGTCSSLKDPVWRQ